MTISLIRIEKERFDAICWAKATMEHKQGFVILDLETTGLPGKGKRVETCQIGIVDHEGNSLVSTLVKPTVPIDPGASKVTGIYDGTVELSPTFPDVSVAVHNALQNRHIVIYNKAFDWPVMQEIFALFSIPEPATKSITCAMENYAKFHGQWNDYHGSFRWQKLTVACKQMGINVEGDAHDATVDCLMTLELIKAMAVS